MEPQKELLKDKALQDIDNHFYNRSILRLEVLAGDDYNAEEKAESIARQSIDVMNFFADLFASVGIKACISLVGTATNL